MTPKVILSNFESHHFEALISWIASEKELIQFAGPIFAYPLTTDQLLTYIDKPNRRAFAILSEASGQHIGHGEIFQKSNSQVDLSRLLIGDPTQRGKGLGTAMVKSLILRAQEVFAPKEIRLKVYTWNTPAIRCYRKVGFRIDPTQSFETPFEKEVWKAHEMVLPL